MILWDDVIIYFQKPPLISAQLIKMRLFIDVINKEFDKYPRLALLNNHVCHVIEMPGK